MEDTKRISRKEAAQMLGVCCESVSNLARRGALTIIKQGKWHYFNRDEVEALIPKCEGMRDIEAAIARAEDDLREEEKRRIGEVRAQKLRREYIEQIAGSASNFNRYHDVVLALYDALVKSGLYGKVEDRERDIVEEVLNFTPIHEIADSFCLTRERINQLFNRALRRIVHFSRGINENYKAILAENERLRLQNADLANTNKKLNAELIAIKPRTEGVGDFINTDLSELGLSVRSFHCLRAININTLADLTKTNRGDLMKCRNFGRKSLEEIDRLLERYGLSYGMTADAPKPTKEYYYGD